MTSEHDRPSIDRRDAVRWLRETQLLAQAADDDLAWLAARAELRTFPPGAHVIDAGQAADALVVIVAGRVLVEEAPGDEAGSGVQVAVGPGETLSELAVLEGAAHTVTAIAREPTVVLAVSRGALLARVGTSPAFATHLLATVAGWARRADRRAAELALRSPGAAPFAFRRFQPTPGERRAAAEE
jgi:CRP-like cAMP-binding protein